MSYLFIGGIADGQRISVPNGVEDKPMEEWTVAGYENQNS